MKLKWQQAPIKTQWGDDMVVSSIAIDNDHTVDLYCERGQALKVEAMFAQRTWVGLVWGNLPEDGQNHDFLRGAVWAEAKLKELNT